jgi:hypothetical protein
MDNNRSTYVRKAIHVMRHEGPLSLAARTVSFVHRRVRSKRAKARDTAVHADDDGTLYAFYDLDAHPISFDMGWFVMAAELRRRELGLRNLHVIVVPMVSAADRPVPANYDAVVDLQSRMWRLHNVVVPFAAMAPSSTGYSICSSREQAARIRHAAAHSFPQQPAPLHIEYTRAVNNGLAGHFAEAGYRATVQGLRYVRQWMDDHVGSRRMVVVTLRQYKVDVGRNSDPEQWLKFARSLDPEKYAIVFVPDTDHAFDKDEGWFREFPTFDCACWNMGLRMALYESAFLNLTVNTGVATLCMLNPACRYLFLKVTAPEHELASNEFIEAQGFPLFGSPRFATAFQKWVWEADTFEVIEREFKNMVSKIEAE